MNQLKENEKEDKSELTEEIVSTSISQALDQIEGQSNEIETRNSYIRIK